MKVIDLKEIRENKKALGAIIDNRLYSLDQEVESYNQVKVLDIDTADGIKIYKRGLAFILYMALKELNKKADMKVFHSLSRGIYIEFKNVEVDNKFTLALEEKMREIVEGNYPFRRLMLTKEEACEIYKKEGLSFKAEIINDRSREYATVYECNGYHNDFYGILPFSTGVIDDFSLLYYGPGIIVFFPDKFSEGENSKLKEQPKMHKEYMESEKWAELSSVSNIYDLNRINKEKRHRDLIYVQEALHEKKINQIADDIYRLKKRIILIAGPSSSGKTTFAQRLAIALRVLNLEPVSISVDNYFINRDKTPLDEFGQPDFESLSAIDVELFNKHLKDLLDGKKVKLPIYDFKRGVRVDGVEGVKINQNQPIIIEGIHGLNDELTPEIFKKDKYKIYVSCLTHINLDPHNPISTTDNRILRRMVRDNNKRGYGARETLKMWDSVKRGENRYVFPHQENADAIFNSSLLYELSVLKRHAFELINDITPNEDEYPIARRLLNLLDYIVDIPDETNIPSTSIIREFIGGSSLE